MADSDRSQQALRALADLFRRERDAARQQQREQRELLDFGERVRRGLALAGLTLEDTDAAAGGRVLLWAKLERAGSLEDTRVGVGDPVLLWAGSPEGERREQGVVARVGWQRLAIAVPAEYGEFLEQGAFNLDREAPETTFERGQQAITRFMRAERGSRLERMREVIFGDATPEVGRQPAPASFFDPKLDDTQRDAVAHALAAKDVALIHGPPGTGKTRTLVEVVRQALARGDRVLVSAASNAAVDNLGERLVQAGVLVVRLGHPARVSPALEPRSLDALVDGSDARQRAKRWISEANALRSKVNKRRARGKLDWQEGRQMLSEARNLMRDARQALDAERAAQLSRAQVICATAAGVDTSLLADTPFDLVVLDEATQAIDPIALAALARAPRAVLAGDPKQLPPTVLDPRLAAEGLGTTLFERLAERWGERVLRMLQVQYRMHEALMRFPSESMYEGKLRAAAEVAQRNLEQELGALPDPLRPGPWHFVDVAGKGFVEARDADDPSTSNPALAERTAREVLRVLSRGVPASDVAVITPYLAQVRRLRELLRDACNAGLEVGSVDGFQGREKEVVVVDLVRSNDDGEIGFLADTRRMNVAITRARSLLLVLGDSATLQANGYYQAFMDAAERDGAHLSAWSDEAEPLA